MMAELDSGDSSMLDALERSVDERLAATKRELLKVTDFRKRAMTLLQTKLGTTRLFSLFVMRFPSAFCLFSHAMRSQRSWRLAMIRRLQLRSVPPSNRGMLTLHSLSLSLLPSLRLCGSRTSTHTRVVSHRLSGTSSSAKSDAAAHPDSTAEADAAAGGVEDPIGALLALDSDEQQTREALEQAQQQMQSMRLQQTGASESGGEGLEAGEEEAMDLSLDQQVSALKQNLTRIHEQRTELFRYLQPRRLHPLPLWSNPSICYVWSHERLHPERLLRTSLHDAAQRLDALRSDRDRLHQQLSVEAVYAAPPAPDAAEEAENEEAAEREAQAFGAKQALTSWVAVCALLLPPLSPSSVCWRVASVVRWEQLIEAEIADLESSSR
jgi:hypothetical protein